MDTNTKIRKTSLPSPLPPLHFQWEMNTSGTKGATKYQQPVTGSGCDGGGWERTEKRGAKKGRKMEVLSTAKILTQFFVTF